MEEEIAAVKANARASAAQADRLRRGIDYRRKASNDSFFALKDR
jgi:hypothetical protein